MITGKYDLDPAQAEYLAGLYSRKHFERPKFGFFSALKDKLCGWNSGGDSDEDGSLQTQDLQLKKSKSMVIAADKKDDEVLDKALDGILERQLDMKHVMQLVQDMELIKRVVFQERH